ncbi:MAG: enoyl-CoA hydratase-related protein [Dehalococcoidia bacterium]|nr:enoyl-CoA hydratase-related protein [Dehalococcoidia bacterium]
MSVLLYEKKGKIVYLTLNRPDKMNAFDQETIEELGKAWVRFRDDPESLVAIITGAGEKAFCTGFDLGGGGGDIRATLKNAANPKNTAHIAPTTFQVWKPVIAAINGFCIGGGWWIAQDCDLRIAADHAQFSIATARWNLAEPNTGDMWRYLAPGHALELMLVGDRINAQRAYEMGFVNKVVPKADLMSAATAMANKILENGPVAATRIKELFYKSREMNSKQTWELMEKLFIPLYGMDDSVEGVKAFGEKRKPVYQGK